MLSFRAKVEIIDGNPFVAVPKRVLDELFRLADRDKSPIPIRGTINGKPYQQTLVRYRGDWRLYVNMQMLEDSPRRVGETVDVEVTYDPSDRSIDPHPKLQRALDANDEARARFVGLTPSRQKEIIRYIASLKTEASVDRNVERTINFLLGRGRFVGRDQP